MNDLSKFDPSAPWYEFLRYQNDCSLLGKEDSVQKWQENLWDIKGKPKVTKKGKRFPGVTEGWEGGAPALAPDRIQAPKIPNTIKKKKTKVIDDPKTRSVEIMYEGKAYPSISAAAKAHGVSAQTISRRHGRYKK